MANATKSKCTTPFTIGKLQISENHLTSLFVLNIIILLVNIVANSAAIFALIKSQPLRRRPSIVLILYLCLSDLSYAFISQILFSIKMFYPELPCIYDLLFEFFSSVLAHLSLGIVVLISVLRYLHTRYMLQVRSIVTKSRVRYSASFSLVAAVLVSSISAFGSTYGDIGVYLQIETFVTALGVALILLVGAIYRKTEIIARKRKAAAQYEMHYTCYSEKVLRKIMLSTLLTLLPLRIPFFASTVVKSVTTEIYQQKLTWWMQYIHLSSYEILCLSAAANALIFIYNNAVARKLIWFSFSKWIFKSVAKGGVVVPINTDLIVADALAPVVTTGWYDGYIPTAAPTTLSTAVVGRKVTTKNEKSVEKNRKKNRKKRKAQRRKRRLQEEKAKKQEEKRVAGEKNTESIGGSCENKVPLREKMNLGFAKPARGLVIPLNPVFE